MAEVMGMTNMFSPFSSSSVIGNHHHHQHRESMFLIKSTHFSCEMGFPSLKLRSSALRSSSSSSSDSDFYGRRVGGGGGLQWMINRGYKNQAAASNSQMSNAIGKAPRWWEKGLQPNMREVDGTQDLVDSLLNAGDKLVVVDFFSPGCGGCKALHPKICQLAEMNPDVQFLQVNYEEHKSMSYTLNVHVLPFFRFYRGSQGRVCSFSCTIASIKKFKDALAKHSLDRCSLGPTKGLEEKELVALSANKELSFNYTPKPEQSEAVPADEDIPNKTLSLLLPLESTAANAVARNIKDKTLVLS